MKTATLIVALLLPWCARAESSSGLDAPPGSEHVAGTALVEAPPVTTPAFVPYQLSEEESSAVITALGEVPAKYSMPIINFMRQLEDRARARWSAEHARPH